ncbi:putative helitron helicase-like protein, partial [Pseudoloma neurophilia]
LSKVVYWFYSVENQKRGLPHIHLCVKLEESVNTVERIDQLIRAEIPGEDEPALRSIVLGKNIHGPCNVHCLVNGTCKKGFPKQVNKVTHLTTNDYPRYKRGEGQTEYNGRVYDNRYVVPYNAWLSLKYQSHINVEVSSSLLTVKYLNKYITKGYDLADVDVRTGESEVERFRNVRYLTGMEAMWRIFESALSGNHRRRSSPFDPFGC